LPEEVWMVDRGKQKYTIGELSEICGISKKTLRFYDTKGLLQPSERDEENHYRYYSQHQVLTSLIIREMRLRGFDLSEWKDILKSDDIHMLKDELDKKIIALETQKEQIERQMQYTRNTRRLVSNAIDHYEKSQDIEENRIIERVMPEMTVVFTRYKCRIIASDLFWDRYIEIRRLKEEEGLSTDGPFSAVFHDHYFNQFFFEMGDLEVFIPVKDNGKKSPNIKKYGGFPTVSKIHVGKYSDLLPVYVELVNYIEEKGYTIAGSPIEEYLLEFSYGVDEKDYLTRLSFPIEAPEN
jgi:DNA-binding transcriptional MerR regulator/effector-binding domain-containing protein